MSDELSDQAWDGPPKTMDRHRLESTNIAMFALTSVVFVARVIVRIFKRKQFEWHDFLCVLAYVCYMCMWVMYHYENDPLYRAESAQRGEIPFYVGIIHDAGMIYRWMTAAQLLFYTSLLLVKLSLLTLYHQLLDKAPTKFTVLWWAVCTYCVLAWIGSSMTTIFVCDNQKLKYTQGICAKPNEQKRALFSLWFAYAVDVTSDLAVMFLPFRMTWSLQMARTRKLGVFVLFGSGWVCILFATLRVVQVGTINGVPEQPDPKWLQMWTIIETSMAVIIGCAPAFASIIHKRFGTLAISYDSRGYVKRPSQDVTIAPSETAESADGSKSGSSKERPKRRDHDLWATETHASEDASAMEEAAPRPKKHRGPRLRQ